ncbi:MAG: phosphatidylglycerol lysyltransferase domain-containing protein [Candidatus Saganbacteria bacterium]|nr:phosphatidylglycerol lysyltransferase domain-containing protein [Candidatus Saganbacteria bacterium]
MDIPQFPGFKPLKKEDKPVFEEYYSKRPLEMSDYTFTNFFIWRLADNTELTLVNGNLCAYVTAPDRKRYFMMPLGENKMEDTLMKCLSTGTAVIRTNKYFVDRYIRKNPAFKAEEDRDNFDYIYLAKDLMELKGKKYDGKRNHINSFLKSGSFEYEDMDSVHIGECIALNEKWCLGKKRESEEFPNIECEGAVVKEALLNFKFLGLKGGVIKINGRIKAFSLGERLNDDTAAIHIEKADPAIRGLSQLINREFARNAWSSFTFINREQDMGHAGLRKAKLSYHPVKMVSKFNITLM